MSGNKHRMGIGDDREKTLKRAGGILVVTLLLATAVVILVARPAAAASGTTTEVGWIGWDGNSVIYPTKDALGTCLPAISTSYYYRYFNYPKEEVGINNSLVVGTSIATPVGSPGVNGETCGPWYGWDTSQGEFFLNVPFYTVSATNITGLSNNPPTVQEIAQMGAVDGVVASTGFPGDAVSGIHAGYYKGLNTTQGSVPGQSGNYAALQAGIDTGLAIAAFIDPEIGVPIAVAEVMNNWLGIFGAYDYPGSPVSDISNNASSGRSESISLWALAQNGSYKQGQSCKWVDFSSFDYANCGSNVFSESSEIQASFPDPDNVTAGTMTISAGNQVWIDEFGVSNTPSGGVSLANASLSYLVEPAVSIGGTVSMWSGGPPAAGATITLQQNSPLGGGYSTDVQISTNASGYWHFFAEPGATYGGSTVTYNNGIGADTTPLIVPSTSATQVGKNNTANTAFSDVGELKGSVKSSSGGIDGAGLTLTNNANGNATSVYTTNSQGSYSGLFYYPTSNGINSFHLTAAAGGYCPSSVTLTDLSPGTAVTENFQLSSGCGGGGGCVAFGTPILTADGYVAVQQLRAGTIVVEFNLSSGQLTTGSLVSANATPVTKVADINSGALYLTPTDQPIFIRNSTFEGWLHDPQNLTTSDQLFDPITGVWISVTSVEMVGTHINVYDVVTTHLNDFVANGYLLDTKLG